MSTPAISVAMNARPRLVLIGSRVVRSAEGGAARDAASQLWTVIFHGRGRAGGGSRWGIATVGPGVSRPEPPRNSGRDSRAKTSTATDNETKPNPKIATACANEIAVPTRPASASLEYSSG